MRIDKRFFSLFLIVLLAVGMVLPVLFAQENDYAMLSVSVDEVYVLRGGSFHVDVVSNSSLVAVSVVAPNGSLYASWNQNANTSRLVNVPMNAPYGTYAVRAVVDGNAAETWLSVLDVVGWSGVSFPYTRRHLNVDYTFFANGTVRAVQVNTGDVFEVDLSMLRGLNGDWSAYTNSMCFRARFTKNAVVVDLTFAFVHTGCKFVVNGSLGQPREFTFEIANPSKLKSVIDGVKQGSLVFDWGDLRRAAHVFSYADGVLSLSLPAEFTFDPTLFSDGFESGNFDAWDSTEGSLTVSTTLPHHGTYSGKGVVQTAVSSARCWKTISSSSAVYYRAYVNFDGVPDTNGEYITFIRVGAGSSTIAQVGLFNVDGTIYWGIRAFVSGSAVNYISAVTPTIDTWYCVEMKVVISGTIGELRLYLDGVEILTQTNKDTNDFGNITTLTAIVHYLNDAQTVPITVYCDCVVVADAYIGPETEGEFYEVVSAWSTSESFSVVRQWQAKNAVALTTGESYLFNGASNCKLTPNWVTSESYTVVGQWQANKALTLQTAESFTIARQWNAQNPLSLSTGESYALTQQTNYQTALSLETEEAFAFNSQAAYALSLTLNAAFSWLLGSGTNHNLALSLTQGAMWLLNAQAGYHSALSWITGENFMLTTQSAYKLALSIAQAFSWLLNAHTTFNLALPFAEGFSWLFNAQTNYGVALSLTQGYSWLLDILHIPHVVTQIVDLVWNAPFAWTTQLQSAFNVALTWVSGQTWTIDLIKGLAYVLDLAWQTGFAWMLGLLPVEIAGGILGIAAVAFIIAIVALGVAAFVMLRRKED